MPIQFKPSAEYIRNLPTYLRHDDFIDGQVERVEKYLIPHMAESSTSPVKAPNGQTLTAGQAMWGVRRQRLANENFCNPILTYYLSFLAKDLTYSDALAGDDWSDIRSDVDGFGSKLKMFVRDLAWSGLGYGYVGCLVEGTESTSQGREEARARGERSFAMLYQPWAILSTERFREMGPKRGKFKDVWLLEGVTREGKDPVSILRRFWIENQGGNYKSQRFATKAELVKVDGTFTSATAAGSYKKEIELEPLAPAVDGAFDSIPFEVFGTGPIDSVIYGVVPRNREHLNKKSAYDAANYYQCFQRIAGFGIDPDELKAWNESLMAFFSNPQGRIDVIEAGNPTALREDLDNIKRDAFLEGLQRTASMHQMMTKQIQSADAKREDNNAFIEYLNHLADQLESFANSIVGWLWRFETSSEPDESVSIKLNRDFTFAPTQGELADIALLVSWLREYGQPGREVIANIVASKVQELRLPADNKNTEEQLKKELADGVLAEAKKPGEFRQLRKLGQEITSNSNFPTGRVLNAEINNA